MDQGVIIEHNVDVSNVMELCTQKFTYDIGNLLSGFENEKASFETCTLE